MQDSLDGVTSLQAVPHGKAAPAAGRGNPAPLGLRAAAPETRPTTGLRRGTVKAVPSRQRRLPLTPRGAARFPPRLPLLGSWRRKAPRRPSPPTASRASARPPPPAGPITPGPAAGSRASARPVPGPQPIGLGHNTGLRQAGPLPQPPLSLPPLRSPPPPGRCEARNRGGTGDRRPARGTFPESTHGASGRTPATPRPP